MKKDTVYKVITFIWWLLLVAFSYDIIRPLVDSFDMGANTFFIILFSTLIVLYFWLNLLKEIVYTLFFFLFSKDLNQPKKAFSGRPFVELIYYTHNDFNANSLLASMQQDYPRVKTVIIDDSTKNEYKKKVDYFAKKYGVTVIRYKNQIGYQTANVNRYLEQSNSPFFVVMNSNEILPQNYIRKALPYFAHKKVAVVQGHHISSSNRMVDTYSDGREVKWNIYKMMKNTYGFLSLLGHSAMIRKEAYEAVGGFPYVATKDLQFSIALRNKGYYVRFAPELVCHDEYSLNYLDIMKRHAVLTAGNIMSMRSYTRNILESRLKWYEKLDLFLISNSIPLSVIFILYLMILHVNLGYSMKILTPSILLLFVPMISDVIFVAHYRNIPAMVRYYSKSFLFYCSMLYESAKKVFESIEERVRLFPLPRLAGNK